MKTTTPAADSQVRGPRAGDEPAYPALAIRPFTAADAEETANLAQGVFDEHVAPSFGPEGIAEMHAHLQAQAIAERARTHTTLVAWDGSAAVGVLELEANSHVSMLFVRTSHMGRGIATELVTRAEAACRAAGSPAMTVNSSLVAQGFYQRLGFVASSEPQRVHGFVFVPMEKQLSQGEVAC